MLNRIRRRWYELRWGPEEAAKLLELKGRSRATRLAILEAHGTADADILFERRLLEQEMRKKAREETADDTYLKLFEKDMQIAARRFTAAIPTHPDELKEAAEEMDRTSFETDRQDLLDLRQMAVEVITEKNRTAVRLASLKRQREFLEAMLVELPSDNIMRADLERQLAKVREIIPECESTFPELCREVERMKSVVREKEEQIKRAGQAKTQAAQ